MKIGDLARLSGLTERMLRHYESLGILCPPRTAGGTRDYAQSDLDVARLAQRFRAIDVPLEVIADIARERRAHPSGDSSQRAIAELLGELANNLTQQAERALALRQVVVQASEVVRACQGCENRPGRETCPDCPMNEAAAHNPVAAMIWQGD